MAEQKFFCKKCGRKPVFPASLKCPAGGMCEWRPIPSNLKGYMCEQCGHKSSFPHLSKCRSGGSHEWLALT